VPVRPDAAVRLASSTRPPAASTARPSSVTAEVRVSIAFCFGALGPVLYGHLIGTGSDPFRLFIGYLIGAGAMVFGGIVELVLGIPAEGKSLEEIARPLSLVRKNVGAPPTS
jgi:hypothetical protein